MHGARNKLGREIRAIVSLAVPVALAQLGMMALGMVDVMMVGHLSPLALAAVSLGHTYTFGMMIFGMGILFILDPLISQAHGARDTRRMAEAMHRGAILAVFLSIPLGVLFFAARPLLLFLSRQPEVVPTAHAYAKIIALSLPAYFLFIVVRQTLLAMSIVRPVMIAVLLGNAVNVFLNFGFVYGRFGFPALGAVGSAWSSTCSRYFMLVVLLLASSGALRRIWHPPTVRVLRLKEYWPMLVKGSQIGIQMALEVWIFTSVSFLMMRMGVVEMGGHMVALNLASLAFMIPIGIGAAAATRVGNALGAGDRQGARRSARVSLCLGAGVMLVSATLFETMPGPLAGLYTSDPAVLHMAVLLLPIAGLFQVLDGTQVVACGVLRGAGDTKIATLINLLGYWGIGLPTGLLLAFRLGWGPQGLWWGLTAGLLVCAVLLLICVLRRIGRPTDVCTPLVS